MAILKSSKVDFTTCKNDNFIGIAEFKCNIFCNVYDKVIEFQNQRKHWHDWSEN